MRKLLHIVATPREDESRTLKISEAFLETFQDKHSDWVVEELNLAKMDLPKLTMKRATGKYVLLEGKDLFGDLKDAWQDILFLIDQFLHADGYLVSAPMWNFSIPYMLKQYIDLIVQPKYLFRYTEKGVEGLVKGKKMLVIASYGGQYVSDQARSMNFHEPYLRAIFGFVGLSDMTFLVAQPTDMGKEIEQQKVEEAIRAAKELNVW